MSVNKTEITEKLKEILLSAGDGSFESIDSVNEQTRLQTDLGLTSVNMLYLIIATEEEFGIRFDDVGMNEFKTVGDVVSYIGERWESRRNLSFLRISGIQ